MQILEHELDVPLVPGHRCLLAHLSKEICRALGRDSLPIRAAVSHMSERSYKCQVGVLVNGCESRLENAAGLFAFRRRLFERNDRYVAVLVVPTGVGAEIGGHSGDATPVAAVLAQACDVLITHPNVVSASDINELPENAMYVEGSVLARLLMGSVGLQPVRSNQVLVVLEPHSDELFIRGAINTVNAARATYGLRCSDVILLDESLRMEARFAESGNAAGLVRNVKPLLALLDAHLQGHDAVAVSSRIEVPTNVIKQYFQSDGEIINPWGGIEAMLTHTLSTIYDVPSAHAPMMESMEVANLDLGIVDPRMAAEAVSTTFLNCVLKGLWRAPRILTDASLMKHHSTITASDLSALVVPDGCLGLPTLAALEQGITVIAVRENQTILDNDLPALPWRDGQFYLVDNYWEAAGVLLAIRAGVAPESLRRPISRVRVGTFHRTSAIANDDNNMERQRPTITAQLSDPR